MADYDAIVFTPQASAPASPAKNEVYYKDSDNRLYLCSDGTGGGGGAYDDLRLLPKIIVPTAARGKVVLIGTQQLASNHEGDVLSSGSGLANYSGALDGTNILPGSFIATWKEVAPDNSHVSHYARDDENGVLNEDDWTYGTTTVEGRKRIGYLDYMGGKWALYQIDVDASYPGITADFHHAGYMPNSLQLCTAT